MQRIKGFSILEVMIAVTIFSAVGAGIYKLQLANLSTTQQITTKQLMMQSAISLSNQIYINLNYCANNVNNRVAGCSAADGSSAYTETTYTEHASNYTTNCATTACNDANLASYILYNWKQSFESMNLPSGNIKGILCRDNSLAAPTTSSPNCSGSGGLVIKIVWQSHIENAESTSIGQNNFIILAVPAR